MKGTFYFTQNACNLRNDPELQRCRNRTLYFETESISSLAPKIVYCQYGFHLNKTYYLWCHFILLRKHTG